MVRYCISCNTPAIDDEAFFCNKCGSKLPVEKSEIIPTCKNCGIPIVDNKSLFCNKCGAPIKGGTDGKIQIENKPPLKQKNDSILATSKKYANIPFVADDKPKNSSFSDKKNLSNSIDTIPKSKNVSTKQIQETRCTCSACGKVWYFGKSEVYQSYSGKLRNAGKSISACTCCWPMSYMSREKTDLEKCPNCGSKLSRRNRLYMMLNDFPTNICIKMIKFHQNHISHHLNKRGIHCRFYPTCSDYGIMVIQKYGVITGIRKTWNRLKRCRPDNFESCIDYP